jgi:hypothetical protein
MLITDLCESYHAHSNETPHLMRYEQLASSGAGNVFRR